MGEPHKYIRQCKDQEHRYQNAHQHKSPLIGPIKLASRQPADTNPMKKRYESCPALPYQWLSMFSSVCGLAPGKVLGSTKITHQRLTAIGQSIIVTIRALTIHGTDCGMKPARRIPRTMLLARPGIKTVVSAGIEREPKRTVLNDLGRTLTVALPLFVLHGFLL